MGTYNVDLQDYEGNSYRFMANPDSAAEFTPAAERGNIRSGETHRTIFGKIAKNLSDLKTVAFSGSYTDLANKPTIPSGAAANYPVINNDVTNNAGYLVTAQVAYQHGQEIDKLNSDLAVAKSNFQVGCSTIAGKITACGVSTAANASPTTMANNIQIIYNNRYNRGYTDGSAGKVTITKLTAVKFAKEDGSTGGSINNLWAYIGTLYSNYSNITVDNIFIKNNVSYNTAENAGHMYGGGGGWIIPNISYLPQKGAINISNIRSDDSYTGIYGSILYADIYIIV